MRIVVLLTLAILLPVFSYSAELININTADATLLDTLPGIGPAYAIRIIDYRTANGPFASIEDIQNVSGIGPVTYAEIAPLITIGNTSAPINSDSANSTSTQTTATTTITTVSSGGAPPEYIPIPTLRIITSGDRTVSSGADTPFTAVVYDGKGNKRDDALILWSFGDGMQRTGASVYHSYYYPGEYIAVAHISTSDGGNALKEMVITAKDASIKIASVSARGISLANDSQRTLDLSLWRLSMSEKEFKIPAGTQILPGRTILFPSQIIQLPTAGSASLLYPSGEVAATYPLVQARVEKPTVTKVSYEKVQEVEKIISAQTNIQAYDEAVIAPAASTELAAAGAASSTGVFSSPWFLSLIGVLTLAGSAFIFF
ncbi:MAG: helix-hairpin-helix domain-containing protein [bacterium]|nr:helix-hairpin-helix domain-containing protein [bacterium]